MVRSGAAGRRAGAHRHRGQGCAGCRAHAALAGGDDESGFPDVEVALAAHRVVDAAYRSAAAGGTPDGAAGLAEMRKAEGASTLTMQLAGTLFLDRTDRSFRRKVQEALLAMQIVARLRSEAKVL